MLAFIPKPDSKRKFSQTRVLVGGVETAIYGDVWGGEFLVSAVFRRLTDNGIDFCV